MVDKRNGLLPHSWQVPSERVAEKTLDKTAFLAGETGIPKYLRDFFDVDKVPLPRYVVLHYEQSEYEASIEMENGRTVLKWNHPFKTALRDRFPEHYAIPFADDY